MWLAKLQDGVSMKPNLLQSNFRVLKNEPSRVWHDKLWPRPPYQQACLRVDALACCLSWPRAVSLVDDSWLRV